ncbi:hypothetical protein [Aldersonia kunmingensis]|uniref:hypothetical protein n=1 Tax=Aldersonia kunmingensis TaxID=408066 RepID=UPI000830B57B|nr:hypothetical protein [Aldersonia kunmingensis]
MTPLAPADTDLVRFAARWSSLGGGPKHEIRARFGLEPLEFFSRIHDILEVAPPEYLSGSHIDEMKRVARRRRWLAA